MDEQRPAQQVVQGPQESECYCICHGNTDSRVLCGHCQEQQLPTKLAVDADGFVWRVFVDEKGAEAWSMARINPDNNPVPHPITYYFPVKEPDYAQIHADAKRIGDELDG